MTVRGSLYERGRLKAAAIIFRLEIPEVVPVLRIIDLVEQVRPIALPVAGTPIQIRAHQLAESIA